jgi:hypothetical protein
VFESLVASVLFVLVVADVAAHVSRRHFLRAGDAFRCRLRTCGYTSALWPRLTRRWSRPMWALWVEDVLVVRRGPVVGRLIPLRAQLSTAGVYTLPPHEVSRCGRRPIAVGLWVCDGSRIEVAAEETARLALVGPYLIAATSDLPQAPNPRRPR